MNLKIKKRKHVLFFSNRKKIPRISYLKMSDLYEKLCKKATLILKKYNPCNIKNGKCLNGYPCCDDCEFISKKGCIVDSLACKLWLCDKARINFKKCYAELNALEIIAKRNPYLPLGERSIKEDAFSFYEIKD